MTDRTFPDLEWLTERPIAHRGWHGGGRGPENSLASFAAAAEAGFAIECDAHPTVDGDVVVFHDETLDRLTGETGSTRDRTIDALHGVRLAGSNETIPSLRDALDIVAGRVPIVIELKGFGARQDGLVAAVAGALATYNGRAAIMSFDQFLVARFRTDAPGVPCGLTAEGRSEEALAAHERVAGAVDFVSYHVDALPNPFAAAFRASGRPVITWTVRTADQIARTRAHADQMTFEGFGPRTLSET